MSRNLVAVSSMEDFVEEGLVEMSQMGTYIKKVSHLTELLAGLTHAHEIQIANAKVRVAAARADLRTAEDDLSEAEENGLQMAEIEAEIIKAGKVELATLMVVTRLMSEKGAKLGWKHGRDLPECSPSEQATV